MAVVGSLVVFIVFVVLWFRYAPEQWLPNMGMVSATVDGQPVQAELYIGNPTHIEAEAIALFRVPGAGAYFLSFEDEKYREASEGEFVRTPLGSLDSQINAPTSLCSSAAISDRK